MNERQKVRVGKSRSTGIVGEENSAAAKVKLVSAMFMFGTIGIFVRYIPLSSGVIAFARGSIGMLFLCMTMFFTGRKFCFAAIKENLAALVLSGIFIGFNWILLFESYRYTTVAVSTLCYYLAPVFVILASPFVLKEKLTGKKMLCVAAALAGMVFVSGVFPSGFSEIKDLKGILYGVGAAVLYASVVLLNKKIHDISAYDKTIVQLGIAAAVLVPYLLLSEDLQAVVLTPMACVLLLVVGILHTGIAYTFYFGSMGSLEAQTVAIFSYIDPVVAIILSAVILREKMTAASMLGAVMILGAAMVSELATD